MGVSYLRHINMSSFIDSFCVSSRSDQPAGIALARGISVGRLKRPLLTRLCRCGGPADGPAARALAVACGALY
jgi:hypothetical protein